ncbi:MAG: Gfo/Idh/MocA family oxidoreductase [Cyclobacteriaceae bacterium]|nr:Gfo/Idh/MocA family oxidoreductase [Cyclobacteriaceae bacterium]
MKNKGNINRREFIGTAAAASLAFTIVPRHVVGGPGFVPPSDKVNLAYIGCGTQGLREMCEIITNPELHIVSVCDPNKLSTNYIDWSPHGIRNGIRETLGEPTWGEKFNGIPGGRDIGKELVEKYYAKNKPSGKYKGCSSYSDFRELLEKERDIDAVKIMTPDHLHGYISVAAMKKGKHVVIHKPLANRMYEARLVIDTAKKTGVSTHLLAWSKRSGNELVKKWIAEGRIGKLLEIHNWSNRPVWPQWTSNPTDTPPVPEGFDWDLWLGPVPHRPYHPNYTHNVFRGWYDFGGGSIADMGHYSLWPLFLTLGINTAPLSAEAYGTTTCTIEGNVSRPLRNDVAFPYSCIVHFRFPAQQTLPAFDLFWYDGGMKPRTPVEMGDNALPREGMMFVGDQGKIIAGFRCEKPVLLPESKMREATGSTEPAEEVVERGEEHWIRAFKNKEQSPGSFTLAGPVSETILLGAVALRARKKVNYDSAQMKITNDEEANKFLYREYRPGWEM